MRPAWTLSLVGAVLCVISVTIATLVLAVGEPDFDATLLDRLAGWRYGVAGAIVRAASDVGFFVVLGPVALVLAIVIVATTRDAGRALLMAGAPAIVASATAVFKLIVERERPALDPAFAVDSFSMPSGHSATSAAFAAALVIIAPAGRIRIFVGIVAVAFSLTVGVSRVALGVHFPTDVLAGWCLGTGVTCLLASIIFVRRAERNPQR